MKDLQGLKIPYSSVNLGDVHKRDILKAISIQERSQLYGAILAFNVKVEKDALDLAKQNGIKIFNYEIVYHIYDEFKKYSDEVKEQLRKENYDKAIFPCQLKIMPEFIFNKKDPFVSGVLVENGEVRTSTRLRVFSNSFNVQISTRSKIRL